MELNKTNVSQVDVCVDFTAFFPLSTFKYLLGLVGI